ncbi:MAG: biopolymer transporter ExbD [Pseudomonadota bacterium]
MQLAARRPPRRNLTLLALIDVIFLLLIFFMFSSNLSPFSLLHLSREAVGGQSGGHAEPVSEALGAKGRSVDVFLSLAADGTVRLNGEPVQADALGSRLDALRRGGAVSLAIEPGPSANVQDLTVALEAAQQSGIPFVAIRQ